MIKKDTIIKTAVAHWSEDDDCFIVESALFERVAGTGDTIEEARKMHREMLDDTYDDLVKDRVAGYKTGRPQKPGIAVNCKVSQGTYEAIKKLAGKHEISMGEALDVMAHFFEARSAEKPAVPKADQILKRIDRLERRVLERSASYSVRRQSPARKNKANQP